MTDNAAPEPDQTAGATQDVAPDGAEEARRERVSAALKVGFEAMAAADIPAEDKPRWHQRLIAITNSSKHDLATAEKRLERYWADWESEVGTRPDGV